MGYNPNIPTLSSKRSISQRQIQANFQAIFGTFNDNHAALATQLQGLHNVLTLRPQGSDPATSATQTAIYNKLVSSIPALFFRPNNSQTAIQMTYPSIKTDSSASQYSFIAGPFVIYGGLVKNPTNNQTVTLSPATTLKYVSLTVTDVVNGTTPVVGVALNAAPTSIAGSSFNITFNAATSGVTFNVFYMAIGL